MEKLYFRVFGRQKGTRLEGSALDTFAKLQTQVMGSDGNGATGFATDPTIFALIGQTGGLVMVDEGATGSVEAGDRKMLAGGENPVISEKIASELANLAVGNTQWSNAGTVGAAGAMPFRKRYGTNVTGKNIDLIFVDVRAFNDAPAGTYQTFCMWDVPGYVGLNFTSGEAAKMPLTVDQEVSQIEERVDVYDVIIS